MIREEDQYEIHIEIAYDIMDPRTKATIVKTRFHHDDYDIDVFHNDLDGLIVAEKEYTSLEEARADEIPSWASREVTDDPAYINSNLVGKTFRNGELHESNIS